VLDDRCRWLLADSDWKSLHLALDDKLFIIIPGMVGEEVGLEVLEKKIGKVSLLTELFLCIDSRQKSDLSTWMETALDALTYYWCPKGVKREGNVCMKDVRKRRALEIPNQSKREKAMMSFITTYRHCNFTLT
jgi:hypothetical protein